MIIVIVIVIIIIIVIIKSINIPLVFNKTSSLKIVKYRKPYLSIDISRNVFVQSRKMYHNYKTRLTITALVLKSLSTYLR